MSDYHIKRKQGTALNRQIAERLGWRLVSEDETVTLAQWVHNYGSDMPNPRPGVHVKNVWITPDGKSWASLFPGEDVNRALPPWSEDMNWCMKAIAAFNAPTSVWYWGEGQFAADDGHENFLVLDPAPAFAAIQSLLQWLDWKGRQA